MDQHKSGARSDSDGLWDWNLGSNRIHFSPRWTALVGCTDHEVGNTPDEWFRRVHPEDLTQLTHDIDALRAQGASEFEFRHRMRHKDGTYRWMSCRGGVTRGADGRATRMMGSHSDVTVDTVTDALTGLPNRLLLLDRLTRSIEKANQHQGFNFAVLVLDLGRPAANPLARKTAVKDPLLTAAARRLETDLRTGASSSPQYQGLVARLEDDQFAILLEGLKDINDAKVIADRTLSQLLASFTLKGGEIFLSASIGVAVSATGYTRASEVLRDAETALHRARVLGGSHWEVFDTAVLQSAEAELELETELMMALDRDEIRLVYQPIVSLAANRIVGFEALVRWEHSTLGMIPPPDFIAIAERTGFIITLGNWVLRTACFQLKTWHETIPTFKNLWVSVNLSSLQLKDPALVDQVADALGDSGVDAPCLVLELTEGTAMENPTAVRSLLMRLRQMGVRISIDDFGTGHSSLSYLRQFPVDALKVDQSFVRGMETDKDKAEIIATLAAMSHQLGLHVTAEGIENEGQLEMLRSLSCDSAQGHLFAEPLEVQRATEILHAEVERQTTDESLATEEDDSASPEEFAGKFARLPDRPQMGISTKALSAGAALIILATAGIAHFSRPLPTVRPTSSIAPSAAAGADQRSQAGAVAAKPEERARAKDRMASARPRTMTAAIPKPVMQSPVSLNVLHLHRVGDCEGRLVVSQEGVTFVPEDASGKDAFTLRHTEFLQTLDDKTLTIKTNDRTYRFKAAELDGQKDDGTQLSGLVNSMARLR